MYTTAPMHEHDAARHLQVTRAGLGVILRAYRRPDGVAVDQPGAHGALRRRGYLDGAGRLTGTGRDLARRALALTGRGEP